MEQHGAGHGVQVQHGPDAPGARLCVLDDVVGDDIAGVGTKVALKYFEGCIGSLQWRSTSSASDPSTSLCLA